MNIKRILKILLLVFLFLAFAGAVYFFVFRFGSSYERIIGKADEFYAERKFDEARELYNQASEINAEESYPKRRIETIDSIIRQRQSDERYNNLLELANELFDNGKYLESSQYYFDALQEKPDKEYPLKMVREAQRLVKGASEEAASTTTDEARVITTKEPDAVADKVAKSQGVPQTIPESTTEETKTLAKPVYSSEPANGNYYHVILGVYDELENATHFRDSIKELGMNPGIIHFGDDMLAVTFGSYNKYETALNFLRFVRNDINKDAWVHYREED